MFGSLSQYSDRTRELAGEGPVTAPKKESWFNKLFGKAEAKEDKLTFVPTTRAEAKANADFPNDPEDVEDTRQLMDMQKKAAIIEAEDRKEGTFKMNKLVPKDSPDEKQGFWSRLFEDGQTARKGQSGGNLEINQGHSVQNYSAPTVQIVNDRIDNKAIAGQNDIG